jgi:ribosomal-protein-serine acetyltransferase
METLKNNLITIKPFNDSHLDAFVVAVRESEKTVGQWMPWCTSDYSTDEARFWFKYCQLNIDNKSAYDLGIFLSSNGQLAGGISINRINRMDKIGVIGYWVRESMQNRGIASNATELIKTFGFDTLGLTRLEIIILEDNFISKKLAEKTGAKLECLARNRLVFKDKPSDALVYSLIP